MKLKIFIILFVKSFLIVNVITNSISSRLIEDVKEFCKNRPKKNFCSDENLHFAKSFQSEYHRIITDKIQFLKVLQDKNFQKQLKIKAQKEKEQQIKAKVLEDYYHYFRMRYL
jgi:hypothetical protein